MCPMWRRYPWIYGYIWLLSCWHSVNLKETATFQELYEVASSLTENSVIKSLTALPQPAICLQRSSSPFWSQNSLSSKQHHVARCICSAELSSERLVSGDDTSGQTVNNRVEWQLAAAWHVTRPSVVIDDLPACHHRSCLHKPLRHSLYSSHARISAVT